MIRDVDPEQRDRQVRLRAFEFLAEQTALHGEVLRWPLLVRGFDFEGRRVPLASQQGIFKPAVLTEIPLSIRTAPVSPGEARPYEDAMEEDGLLLYRYRGTDLRHRENVGLRLAMERQVPLVYLYGVVAGEYLPMWPVYVVGATTPESCASRWRWTTASSRGGACGRRLVKGRIAGGQQGTAELRRLYREFYKDEPFVKIVDAPPQTKQTWGSNLCLLYPAVDPRAGRLIVISCIDNLVKGGAGQAIQNMNLMLGFPETTGLQALPVYP